MNVRLARSTGFVATAILLLAGSAVPASAGQMVRFKNGFEMQANAIRFDGDMAYLVLDGGSEIGFPKDVLDIVEQDETFGGEVFEMSGRNKVRKHFLLNGLEVETPRAAVQAMNPEASKEEQKKILFESAGGASIGPGGMNVGFTYDGKTGRTGQNAMYKRDSETEIGVPNSPTLRGGLPKRQRLTPTLGAKLAEQYKK